jgi:CRP/FNR family transcriptional regulator, cyclic AMP receptor protein
VDQERIDLVRRVPLFADLERREAQGIANTLKERTFRAGETITSEGESAVGFFVIQDGEASVSVGGQERGRLGPGDYFGEIALIAQTPRTATVIADTDVRCLGMTFWEFRPLVEENGTIAWKMLQSLARKLGDQDQQPR